MSHRVLSYTHKTLAVVYGSNLLLSFHFFLILYIHSSYIGTFFNPSHLALLYIIGSAVNLLLFLNIPRLLDWMGNYKFTLWSIILEGVAIIGLIVGTTPLVIGISFVLHQAVISMILFGLDIFIEGAIKNEEHTGSIRGLYLTLSNTTLVFSPLVVGILLTDGTFKMVYGISLLFLIPLFFLVQQHLRHAAYKYKKSIGVLETFRKVRGDKNIRGVLFTHLMLQFFYAWMVIYMPIYLHEYVGFSWQQIGVIFTVMLLPFLLFELPIGTLADKKYGEKEIMSIGFIIMILSTFSIPLFQTTSIVAWCIILFLTRVGASFVEITAESYFFKHVNEHNAGLISLFRMARPIAYMTAPVAVTISLYLLSAGNAPYSYIFSVLGVLMIVGLLYSSILTDTK